MLEKRSQVLKIEEVEPKSNLVIHCQVQFEIILIYQFITHINN